ncbi:hypothetical protein Bhyg_00446 [Pseudolycoriella hygida]|uniref:BHLH domain-containing protein n=1 Tax=Pseudolycoriella hygida TaxID=35572 RepID=A0A9Q0N7K4_9DIPT|nr:hypothetical protein Bhyg_00446 [Pseudolycoriella hygida]
MTKGRAENNRAWEKERRDRLNKSFDILAKFLPNYEDSVPFSKIEIIQKSILLIKELQLKLKEALASNHKNIYNTILELEEAFKSLIVRNKVLLALVEKCGGTAPPFTHPKIFGYIATSPLDENDLNELYVKQNGRPPKNSKEKARKKLQTLYDDEAVLQKKKKIKSNKKDQKKKFKEIESDNADESVEESAKCEQGATSAKTTTSESPDKKPNSKSELKDQVQPSLTTQVVATGILLPISNVRKPMDLDSGPIIVVNALPKLTTLMPKPVPKKEIPGKVAIKPLKLKAVPRKQRIRRTKKELEQERKSTEESKLLTVQKQTASDEVIDSNGNKCDKTDENNTTVVDMGENDLAKTPDIQPDSSRIETNEATLPTLPQPELSNEILASLQIPQNESNNESMSPTAAFLMSFPVVSSAGVRIGEEEHETHDPHQSHNITKPVNESNILDNISSLMTPKDYQRLIEDAVKSDANEKSLKDKDSLDKPGSMPFDFQLKPITSSCSEMKTDTFPRTSVTCTSTYLPEISNLSYKSSPSKKRRESTNEEEVINVAMSENNVLTGTQYKNLFVSKGEFMRHHSAMDFITSSSTILNNMEPPTKMYRFSENSEHSRKTDTTSFSNIFHRNLPETCSSATPVSCSTTYNYDKAITTTKSDSKTKATECGTLNAIPSVSAVHHAEIGTSLAKLDKHSEKPKGDFNFPQFFVPTKPVEPTTSVSYCRENQFNSLYSYATNTTTFLSTSTSHPSSNTDGSLNNVKTFEDSTTKASAVEKTFLKPNHSTTSADGFYTSLTSIGTTPQYPNSIMRPNMYSSALSLSSSSNQKALDYAPQTSFTFSLTAPRSTTTTLPSCQQSQNYLTATHSTSCQDYNPFAFENISSISAPLTSYSACRETSQFSFSLKSTTNKITSKNPSQSSFSIDQNFLTETRIKPIIPAKGQAHLEKEPDYIYPKNDFSHLEQLKNKDAPQKVEKSNTKQHVNWMTSTTDPQKNEYPVIPPIEYIHTPALSNHYLPQATAQLSNSQKSSDIYFAHQISEENFPWSPNKSIDAPNICSSTLPNLHGDLALNNSLTPKQQALSADKTKTSKPMSSSQINPSQQNVVTNATNSYFSVSQLVDRQKSSGQSKPFDDSSAQLPKTLKTSSNQSRFKQKDSKKTVKVSSNVSNFTPNIFVESFAYNEPQKQSQTNSNSYSAEALISIHPSKKESKSLSNFANQSEYCNQLDSYNNLDYFAESNYNYYNNTYLPQIPENEYFCGSTYPEQQFHSKSARSSGSSTKHLTSIGDSTAYGSHASQNNLYSFAHPSGKLCQQPSQYKNSSQLSTSYHQSRSYSNANKKQYKQELFPSYDPNSSTNYFTPSLNINTPILPHTPLLPNPHNIASNENFNYPAHLNYSTNLSKTSTYASTQQISESSQINPMLHSNSTAGNLVTNFNLSTICPEINDKTRQQSCYSSSSLLFFGKDIISYEVGWQQGDPCGPLTFSLTIQPMVEKINNEINSWYLDDGSLADTYKIMIEDFKMIIQEAAEWKPVNSNMNECNIMDLLQQMLGTASQVQIQSPVAVGTPGYNGYGGYNGYAGCNPCDTNGYLNGYGYGYGK